MPAGIQKLCVVLARLCLCAWVGAAHFFILVSIAPMRTRVSDGPGALDTLQKAHLAEVLFPGYYAFGFVLMGVSLAAGLLACRGGILRTPLARAGLALLTLALVISVVDWIWIYGPLAQMISAQLHQQAAPPPHFRDYHVASMAVNAISVLLCLAASVLLCWPTVITADESATH